MADSIMYVKTGRTGGTTSDLDGIDGSALSDGDRAMVYEGGVLYLYWCNLTGGAAEDDPFIIVPDANPGSINWELQSIHSAVSSGAPTTKTISAGVLTLNGPGQYLVDTEAAAATDDLDKITGLSNGDVVNLRPASDARTVVCKNGTYLKLPADFTMNNQYDNITLTCIGSDVCVENSRSNNGG